MEPRKHSNCVRFHIEIEYQMSGNNGDIATQHDWANVFQHHRHNHDVVVRFIIIETIITLFWIRVIGIFSNARCYFKIANKTSTFGIISFPPCRVGLMLQSNWLVSLNVSLFICEMVSYKLWTNIISGRVKYCKWNYRLGNCKCVKKKPMCQSAIQFSHCDTLSEIYFPDLHYILFSVSIELPNEIYSKTSSRAEIQ